ncbi:MAG: hypothetical protein PF795_06115, partial [Kiritimatiellae bacterium]|nr:hypothetical protein [Kiritimatiellia bacterium]
MENQAGQEVDAAPATRRAALLAAMREQADQGSHCGSCSGVCCTFLANSMQITPLEARDMRDSLMQQGRWTRELFEQLADTVTRFRLDRELGDGRRSLLRRTYTCPFYQSGPTGCSISPTHKPYGCLAFNPRKPDLTAGGDCASSPNLLENLQPTSPK